MSAKNKMQYEHWRLKWLRSGAFGNQMPQAVVREIDGQLVLDDPQALAMIRVIGKMNCVNTLEMNGARVLHFTNRIQQLQKTATDTVIVVINVDDPYGGPIAEILMPGHDWQPFRDRKETPFARGLADRAGIQEVIEMFDKEAAKKMREMPNEIVVVVVDHSVAEVFPASIVVNGNMIIGCECEKWKKLITLEFDDEDVRNFGWTACQYCKTPFRIRINERKEAA